MEPGKKAETLKYAYVPAKTKNREYTHLHHVRINCAKGLQNMNKANESEWEIDWITRQEYKTQSQRNEISTDQQTIVYQKVKRT